MKTCPQCHTENPDDVKFCGECGTRLPVQATTSASGIAIGDKNTIAGDVVGHQELYRITGNATIVRNEDETKKVVKCHVCGRNLLIAESYNCPNCGEPTCQDCYDREFSACRLCRDKDVERREEEYRKALSAALEDGVVNAVERNELDTLREKLCISKEKAESVENEVRANLPVAKKLDGNACFLTSAQTIALEKAQAAFYDEMDPAKAERLLAPLLEQQPDNEHVVGLHVAILGTANREQAEEFVSSLKIDMLDAQLSLFDIQFCSGDMISSEKTLLLVEKMWPDNILVKARRVVFSERLAELTGNRSFAEEAQNVLKSLGDLSNKMEASWIERANFVTLKQSCKNEISREQCKSKGLYWGIVSGRLSAPKNKFRIEVRGQFGSISSMVSPKNLKEEWEKASGEAFEEIVGKVVSGEFDGDDLPEFDRLPFSSRGFRAFSERVCGLLLPDKETDPWTGISIAVVDHGNRKTTIANEDLRSLGITCQETPLPQLSDGQAGLGIETRIDCDKCVIEVSSSELIEPSAIALSLRTIVVLDGLKRKRTIRVLDGLTFCGQRFSLEPSEISTAEKASRVFWWSSDDDPAMLQRRAQEFLRNKPDAKYEIGRWNKTFDDFSTEAGQWEKLIGSGLGLIWDSIDPDYLFVRRLREKMESKTDSEFVLQAAENGVQAALLVVAKVLYYAQRLNFENQCACWKNVSYESILEKLFVTGSAESAFLLGWWLEQNGRRSEAMKLYKAILDMEGSCNPSIRAYAKAMCRVSENSADEIILKCQVFRDIAEHTGVFSRLSELKWGCIFDYSDKFSPCLCEWASLGQLESSILESAHKNLIELETTVSSSLDAEIGAIELRLGEVTGDLEMVFSSQKRGCSEVEKKLPWLYVRSASLIHDEKLAFQRLEKAASMSGQIEDMVFRAAIQLDGIQECATWLLFARQYWNEIPKPTMELIVEKVNSSREFFDACVPEYMNLLILLDERHLLSKEDSWIIAPLGEMLASGDPMGPTCHDYISDVRKWFALLMKFADYGDSESMWYVAQCFHRGMGKAVNRNNKAALSWAKKAADAGNEEAMEALPSWKAENNLFHKIRGLFSK